MKKTSGANPILAEKLLISGAVLLFVIFGAEFVFVNNFLKDQASQVSTMQTKFQESDKEIEAIKKTGLWLDRNKSTVDKTSKLVADSKMYTYQNQIITDLNNYSDEAGVSVIGYTFSAPTTTSSGKPVVAQKTATAAPTPTTPGAATAAKPPAGVTSVEVNYEFGGKSIGYTQFLTLLQRLEKNVTRMQISSVDLTPDNSDPKVQAIQTPKLTLIVYKK